MGVEYSIRERAAFLISNAKTMRLQLEAQGIQLGATIKYEDAEVYVSHGYDGCMQVRIDWKEPKSCNSAPVVANDQQGQQS